jgi:hypothetical protein
MATTNRGNPLTGGERRFDQRIRGTVSQHQDHARTPLISAAGAARRPSSMNSLPSADQLPAAPLLVAGQHIRVGGAGGGRSGHGAGKVERDMHTSSSVPAGDTCRERDFVANIPVAHWGAIAGADCFATEVVDLARLGNALHLPRNPLFRTRG